MNIDLDPTTKPTLSVDEFARIVGISRGAAYQAVRNSEVVALHFGKRIRIPTAVARRLLELDGPDAPAA